MDAWRRMIAAQGGDPDATLPVARAHPGGHGAGRAACSPGSTRCAVGVAAWRLGAGRARKEDPVQAGAGVEMHAKPGDTVREGDVLLTLHTDTPERFARAEEALDGGIEIGGTASEATSVVIDRIA